MFTHLFRLIWNKKKENTLLILEIFLSFIGLFAAFTFVLYPYNNFKLPLGLQHANVWVVNFNSNEVTRSIDSIQAIRESVKKVLLSMNQVQEVTYCSGNVPFSGNSFNTNIKYNSNEIFANIYSVENNYQNVLGLKVLEGRWFNREDEVSKERPVVVNHILKKELFGEADVVGKILTSEASERMKIVGVVQAFKDESEAEVPLPGLFRRLDTLTMRYNMVMLIKVKPGADAAFESRVFKTLSNNLKSANIEIEHLSDLKDTANKRMQVPLIIFIIVAAFLIINVALGIFGVLWYNINKRKGEIGLRRAVGATGSAISRQLVGEAFVLCTLSLILGLFFAVQLPLLGSFNLPRENYIQAIILALLFIYALVILCALYPGTQAARIYPADALHED